MKNLVKLAKVFSDANRLNILALIIQNKEVCVCEICDTLKLSQPLVSRHLKLMKESAVLFSRQEGKWVIYSLTQEPSSMLQCWINETKKHISSIPELATCNSR